MDWFDPNEPTMSDRDFIDDAPIEEDGSVDSEAEEAVGQLSRDDVGDGLEVEVDGGSDVDRDDGGVAAAGGYESVQVMFLPDLFLLSLMRPPPSACYTSNPSFVIIGV